MVTTESGLPYPIMDADNHFNEPLDCFERYIDPDRRDLAIRFVDGPDGKPVQVFAGRVSRFHSDQVTFSGDELAAMLGTAPGDAGGHDTDSGEIIPGMLLNRLNPFTDLDDEGRAELIARFRDQSESYGNRDLRLALMDDQGIGAALMFPAIAHNIEYELADHRDALYANTRAFNRWMYEEVGFAHDRRMFLPPYIPLADVDAAVAELEVVLDQGAPVVQFKSGHAHGGVNDPFGGRSIADPVFDPVWARINEAGVRVAVHLGGTDYAKYGADLSEDPEAVFGDFDALQWVLYWGDRPAMDLVASMVLHNLFGRFPDVRVCLAEQGTVWAPYLLRKMDHSFFMGRRARWGNLEERPSEIFRRHFVVAPFPEENVERVIDAIGIDSIVFGSDFPHGEGLAFPHEYASSQLAGLSDAQVKYSNQDPGRRGRR